MNQIRKIPLEQLGYNFIDSEFLPKGADEYYLRNLQNRNGIAYRHLNAYEIEVLVRNRNTSDNWNNLLVGNAFNPELVKNCKFYGLVRIGKLEPYFLEFSQLKVAVGLYNSTIISCDFGDNVVVDNVNYLSHYIIGSEVIISNVNELIATPHAKFGNGLVKEGEPESVRIWLEVCNENAGRKIIPFNGMLPGDAWIWSRYRTDHLLLEKFKEFTQQQFDTRRGYYGKIGDRTVIKNCAIIKDVWVGSDAYLKGANKLKNLTINSTAEASTQIGEGCELVNGIIGFGCRIFYGVKAVRFVLSDHSQLKYGARLINSFLGHNSTISCCEVLNSLIFPSHEQHHNNSFLCAALIMGQSNMAAGATIGSNHNSRGADGEMQAGRGFWPGLCVSLKHNSKFASFCMVAKGDYPHELNIQLPFSLVSQDTATNELHVMPAYWFMYNMYAVARNAWKYTDRDKRIDRTQHIEFNYLAPDTVNEMFDALRIIELSTGKAWFKMQQKDSTDAGAIKKGKTLLQNNDPCLTQLDITLSGFENGKRTVRLLKPAGAWHTYRKMIRLYGLESFIAFVQGAGSLRKAKNRLPQKEQRREWANVGGQLMPETDLKSLITGIHKKQINSWDELHRQYEVLGEKYAAQKTAHGLYALQEILGHPLTAISESGFKEMVQDYIDAREELSLAIEASRAKDYSSEFRKMMYNSEAELNEVMGSLKENAFIKKEKKAISTLKKQLAPLLT